jgi:hypothetical protein
MVAVLIFGFVFGAALKIISLIIELIVNGVKR